MSLSFFPPYLERPRAVWRGLTRRIADYMPKGLYARSLLIVIVPMVILQSAIAYFFMERHWQLVTFRLSTAVVQDIASVVDLYRADSSPGQCAAFCRRSRQTGSASTSSFLPKEPLPPRAAEAVLLDPRSGAVARNFDADQAAVLDRHGGAFEPRRNPHPARQFGDARRRQPQCRLCVELAYFPRLDGGHLAGAAGRRRSPFCATRYVRSCGLPARRRTFGKGRDTDWRPHGAREVRQAGYAFMEMKRRIERADGTAHRDAQRRQPRPAHDPDALQTVDRAPGRGAGASTRCRRTSRKCSACWRPIWPSRAAMREKRRRRPTCALCSKR